MDVDHFRPKGTVRERDGTSRPGYPFLAYDFRNYRLAAQLPNQITSTDEGPRGKYQQFPLDSGSPVAVDKAGVSVERTLLLDPTVPDDPRLLTFNEEGVPRPAVSEDADGLGYRRARRTIDVFWLDRTELNDARRMKWTSRHDEIMLVDRMMCTARERSAAGEFAAAKEEWQHARLLLDRLREAVAPHSPYAAAIQACLLTSGREWAERMARRAAIRSLVLY